MKKNNIVLIVSLILIYIIINIYVVFIKKENVVYLGDSTKVYVKKNELIKIKDNSLMNIKKAKIYFNKEFVDGYIRTTSNEIVDFNTRDAFTKDKKMLFPSKGLLAYTGNLSIHVGEPSVYDILGNSEKEKLLKIAKENGAEGDIIDSNKVVFDINNDKEFETIYSFTITNNEKLYSFVILENDDDNEIIESTSSKLQSAKIRKCKFHRFIDFNDDNNYEINILCENGDDTLSDFDIYTYNNGTVVEVK